MSSIKMMAIGQASELNRADIEEFFLWILRQRRRFRVTGNSMLPLLETGEEVLVDIHAYEQHPPEPGDIVVAEHPGRPGLRLVKRVIAVLDTGACLLTGDNPVESTDSRNFGAVPPQKILGRVTSRF